MEDGPFCGNPISNITVQTCFIFLPVNTSCMNSPSPIEVTTVGWNFATYITNATPPKKTNVPPKECRIKMFGASETSHIPEVRNGSSSHYDCQSS